MLSLEEFCLGLVNAKCEEIFDEKDVNEFKIFWISHNQINPNSFPNIQSNELIWLDCYDTYFEGGYGI